MLILYLVVMALYIMLQTHIVVYWQDAFLLTLSDKKLSRLDGSNQVKRVDARYYTQASESHQPELFALVFLAVILMLVVCVVLLCKVVVATRRVAKLPSFIFDSLGHDLRVPLGFPAEDPNGEHHIVDLSMPTTELMALRMAHDLGLGTTLKISSNLGPVRTARDADSLGLARAWSVMPRSSREDVKVKVISPLDEHELVACVKWPQASPTSIFSLPVELLSDIMRLAAYSGPRPTTLGQHRASIQHVLPQVSRGFRDLAFNTPRLWNCLTLPLHLECGQEWILRSRSVALDIQVLLKDAPDSAVNLSIWFLSQAYVRENCRHICVQPSQNEMPSFLFQPASRLEELEIDGQKSFFLGRLRGAAGPMFQSRAPLLRKITLAGFPFQHSQPLYDNNVPILDLSYPRLSDGPTLSEFQNVLHHATNLRHLIIRDLHFDTARFEVPLPPMILFPTLEFLEFRTAAISVLRDLIPRWEMKRPFELTLLSDYTASYGGVLAKSLRMPTCSSFFSNLRRLCVQGSALFTPRELAIDHSSIMSIISQAPQLEDLSLRYVPLCDAFHHRLDAGSNDPSLVPHLRRYFIRDCPGSSDGVFIAMVYSRIMHMGLVLGIARNCLPSSDTWSRKAFDLRIEVTQPEPGEKAISLHTE